MVGKEEAGVTGVFWGALTWDGKVSGRDSLPPSLHPHFPPSPLPSFFFSSPPLSPPSLSSLFLSLCPEIDQTQETDNSGQPKMYS